MIDLGLARIIRLLQLAPPPSWRAVHVAGTNGKGSTCAHLSALLHARGVSCGRFTSPHFVDRWDCVVVDERVVDRDAFAAAEKEVLRRDHDAAIGATEFELLAATAFEIFQRARVSVAVIEAGLGGALDATTAMRATRAATVVTRIGIDHQAFLGSTGAAITAHKAGIMQPGVPCVVDPANRDDEDAEIGKTIEAHARATGTPLVYADPAAVLPPDFCASDRGRSLELHQLNNLACAYAAFRIAMNESQQPATAQDGQLLASVVENVRWPGRLQQIDVCSLLPVPTSCPVLLDGAHNPQSATVLGEYVSKHLRASPSGSPDRNVTWVLAASAGKDLDSILCLLLRPGDRVAAVAFGPVDGMPWVRATAPQTILDAAGKLGVLPAAQLSLAGSSAALPEALQWAVQDETRPIVIAGSLYLVSDTLRLLRQAGSETGLP